MENKPLVSVIMPVYNCERYLPEAIESAMAQSYQPLEIIVVDDGSTDGSADVAKRFAPSVRYCFQPNSGPSVARRRAIDLAQGSFFGFLDADDLWLEHKLTLQMAAFEADPDLDIVSGHVQQFCSPELDESVTQKMRCPTELMPGYLPSALLIKRDSFFRVGPGATNYVGEFMDWYLHATECGLRMTILPDLVTRRRLHETNLGIRQRSTINQRVRILKAALDRRRAAEQGKSDRQTLSTADQDVSFK